MSSKCYLSQEEEVPHSGVRERACNRNVGSSLNGKHRLSSLFQQLNRLSRGAANGRSGRNVRMDGWVCSFVLSSWGPWKRGGRIETLKVPNPLAILPPSLLLLRRGECIIHGVHHLPPRGPSPSHQLRQKLKVREMSLMTRSVGRPCMCRISNWDSTLRTALKIQFKECTQRVDREGRRGPF